MTDIADLDAADLADRYQTGDVSPREVVTVLMKRIDAQDPAIGAFCQIEAEAAAAAAAMSEERWRRGEPRSSLDGVPFTVKDNLTWAGRPTRRGSTTTNDDPAAENAPAVDRLLEAGAIPVGKTTMPEFGWKGLGDSPLYGVARNPWNTRMTTGGSSAGAGAAAALNLCPIHLGTDGAGSLRIPASFCGVFGMKPSFGRVPAYPPSPFAIVSHVGPITRTVRDAAATLDIIAVPDARDITALALTSGTVSADLDRLPGGLRIAWSPRLGMVEHLDPEVEALTGAAARAFEQIGAIVEEVDPPLGQPMAILLTLWSVGAWSVLAAVPEARWAEIDPGFVALAQRGRDVSGAEFVAAAAARGPIFRDMADFHERYDLLLTPTVATPAFEAGHNTPPDGRFGDDWLTWTPYCYPLNLTLQPAASVPCGLTRSGLPVGLQIVGPMLGDSLVMRAARAYERANPPARIDRPRSPQ